jgi:hypothetical protein
MGNKKKPGTASSSSGYPGNNPMGSRGENRKSTIYLATINSQRFLYFREYQLPNQSWATTIRNVSRNVRSLPRFSCGLSW